MRIVKSGVKNIPHILLIGAGRFGQHHLRVLKKLHAEKRVVFLGAVVKSQKSRIRIEAEHSIKAYVGITPDLLKATDVVDIVTPPETHFDLVKRCLKYADVFVEKPMAANSAEAEKLNIIARQNKRSLVIGHIFRYDPVTEKLKKILGSKKFPENIRGSFINPMSADTKREPSMEFLHLFDIVDYIWKPTVKSVDVRKEGRISVVDVRYNKKSDGRFTLGWRGDEKERNIHFGYKGYTIDADFARQIITENKNGKIKKHLCPVKVEPLRKELLAFLEIIGHKNSRSVKYNKFDTATADGFTGARIVSVAEKGIPKINIRPRVAVIGGGIFGTSVAAELGSFCEVTLFEKNGDLMHEGTRINQFRHHYGYHYPRSDETVLEVQRSRADFEKVFKGAIVDTYPTYYGLAKEGSLVDARQFLAFCKKHKLPYKKEYPSDKIMSREGLTLSVNVPEPSYHHERLRDIVKKRLASFKSVKILYNSDVIGCHLGSDGVKEISYRQNAGNKQKKEFDFVINATYASINRLADWMSFEHRPIRVDLAEVIIVKLPIDPISLTIIDGPFATLMPTGNPNEFTLYHVRESILDRYVPERGLLKKQTKKTTNREAIFKESLKWFPVLKDAEVVESRVVNRGVQAYREHDDARVVDLIDHGFGCWSILSGKILSSVTVSKRLAETIKAASRI